MAQNLTRKWAEEMQKENTAPGGCKEPFRMIMNARREQQRRLTQQQGNGNQSARNSFSMTEVSDILYEFYKANMAKAPKSQQQMSASTTRQTSPTSAETEVPPNVAAIATVGAAVDNNSVNMQEEEVDVRPSTSTAVLHPRIKYTNKAAGKGAYVSITGPRQETDMSLAMTAIPTSVVVMPPTSASPQVDIKPIVNAATGLVISPITHANTSTGGLASVIKTGPAAGATASTPTNMVMPSAAALAAALLRDGYQNLQQHLLNQKQTQQQHQQQQHQHQQQQQQQQQQLSPAQHRPFNFSSSGDTMPNTETGMVSMAPTRMLETFLRQHQVVDVEDEDDSRYNGFDDIHLMEANAPQRGGQYDSGLSNLFQISTTQMQAQIRQLDYKMGEYTQQNPTSSRKSSGNKRRKRVASMGNALTMANVAMTMDDMNGSSNERLSPKSVDAEGNYECKDCGKKYRWKSTLRRHENVECGGKEPSHKCPYCTYRSKQRGNLGVHVRKHHADMPQLVSKRRSKYSQKQNHSGAGTATGSRAATISVVAAARQFNESMDTEMSGDSTNNLVIDFAKRDEI